MSLLQEAVPDSGLPLSSDPLALETDIEKLDHVHSRATPSITSTDKHDDRSGKADPNIVGWDGADDPENPMNWPWAKKNTVTGLVSLITVLSPLGSTIISPATEEVMKTFNTTNETLGAFITSVYILGYAIGPLLLSPLSETIGRAPVYNVCNVWCVVFSIACALSPSLGALLGFRFLTGLGASCAMTIGAGTIADVVPVEKRGLAMVAWVMGPIIGPTIGPLAGGYLAEAKGWRWIFWLMAILTGAVSLLSFALMRETYAPVLLERKIAKLRKTTGNLHLRSAADRGISPSQLFRNSILRPLKMLFFSPIVFFLSLYMALIYGYLYLLFTTFPRVFMGQYGWSASSVGLSYIGVGVGSIVGLLFCGAVSDRILKRLTAKHGGESKPEYRLPPMYVGAIVVPAGLFLYGWSADKGVHWIAPIIGSALLAGGMFCIIMPASTYLVDAFTVYAASAAAAATVFRSLLGALLPLAGNKMYDALGIGWGTSLLGIIAVAFLPVPVLFWKYGERMRTSGAGRVRW